MPKIDAFPKDSLSAYLARFPNERGSYILGVLKVSTDTNPIVDPWTPMECLQSIIYNLIVYNHGFNV